MKKAKNFIEFRGLNKKETKTLSVLFNEIVVSLKDVERAHIRHDRVMLRLHRFYLRHMKAPYSMSLQDASTPIEWPGKPKSTVYS